MLIAMGVTAIGFPLKVPRDEPQPDLDEEGVKSVIEKIKSKVMCVIITYLSHAEDIVELCRFTGADWVQLHGDVKLNALQKVKEIDPSISIIKSLVVGKYTGKQLLKYVEEFSHCADAFITDTYDPETGACGATGKTHNWSISKKIVNVSPKPVILAGGLTPKNVYDGIKTVKPAGVDSHSGVEDAGGRKDSEIIFRFVKEANRGFNS